MVLKTEGTHDTHPNPPPHNRYTLLSLQLQEREAVLRAAHLGWDIDKLSTAIRGE